MPLTYSKTCRGSSRISEPRQSIGALDSVPLDFNPADHPIIAKHFFGVSPFRSIGIVAAEVVADLRFRRQVQQVHRLGDRVFGEFLAELGAEFGIQTVIDRKLDTYAEIDPEALAAAGGDDFWPAPLSEV